MIRFFIRKTNPGSSLGNEIIFIPIFGKKISESGPGPGLDPDHGQAYIYSQSPVAPAKPLGFYSQPSPSAFFLLQIQNSIQSLFLAFCKYIYCVLVLIDNGRSEERRKANASDTEALFRTTHRMPDLFTRLYLSQIRSTPF